MKARRKKQFKKLNLHTTWLRLLCVFVVARWMLEYWFFLSRALDVCVIVSSPWLQSWERFGNTFMLEGLRRLDAERSLAAYVIVFFISLPLFSFFLSSFSRIVFLLLHLVPFAMYISRITFGNPRFSDNKINEATPRRSRQQWRSQDFVIRPCLEWRGTFGWECVGHRFLFFHSGWCSG